MTMTLRIRSVPGRYAVARLAPDAEIPAWVHGPGFQSITRSDDELTIVCLQDRVPKAIEVEKDWACFRTIGPFPFDAAGIVKSLITPLSDNGIGVFVICTFDGEHVLVPAQEEENSRRHLEAAGHNVESAT